MCRWIAYQGPAVYMDTLVTKPEHSLVEQSVNARQHFRKDGSIWALNGDGFGVGWYKEKPEPGLFKGSEPAWSNENLHELCAQVKSHLFMAHVRATTVGGVQRSNSHPFKYKNWLFQHNGHIGDFDKLRRPLQAQIPDELFAHIKGSTDSETFFFLALAYGLEADPKAAIEKAIAHVRNTCDALDVEYYVELSCALSDGEKLHTIRYSSGEEANSQYYSVSTQSMKEMDSQSDELSTQSVVVVSEPLDHSSERWVKVPRNSFCTFADGKAHIEPLKL